MNKSYSMKTPPNAIQQPPTEQTLLQPHGITYTARNHRPKRTYYGCCPARTLLGIVFLFQTSLIVIWMIREYFYFDFKCVMLKQSTEEIGDEKAVLIEEKMAYQNDRRSVNSGWKERDHGREVTSQRLSQSDRFPRIPRVDYKWSQSVEHSQSQSSFTKSNEDEPVVNFPRFQRSSRSYLPLSHLMHFPCLLLASPKQDYSKERTKGGQSRNKLHNICFYFPGCLSLAMTQEKNYRLPRKFIPKKQARNVDSITITELPDTASGEISRGGKRRRKRHLSQESNNAESVRRQEANKSIRTKIPIKAIKKTEKGRRKGQVGAGHPLFKDRNRKRGSISRHFKPAFHRPTQKYPSKLGFPKKRRKGVAARNHAKTLDFPDHTNKRIIVIQRKKEREKTGRKKAMSPVGALKLMQSNSARFVKSWNATAGGKRNAREGMMFQRLNSSLGNSGVIRYKNYLKKSGESWEANEPKPTRKRFHFLSGGTGLPGNKSAPRTSWIDGVVDPHDKNFSNKGQIRFYPGKVAHRLSKKRKKVRKRPKPISVRHSQERAMDEVANRPEIVVNEGEKPKSTDASQIFNDLADDGKDGGFGKKKERKWKSAEDAQRRPVQRTNGPETKDSEEAADNNAERNMEPVIAKSITVPTASTIVFEVTVSPEVEKFSVIEEPAEHFRMAADIGRPYHTFKLHTTLPSLVVPRSHKVEMNVNAEDGFARGPKYYMSTPLTTLEAISTVETEEDKVRKRELFVVQLSAFTNSALCITRSLLDCWCVAECVAAIPFLFGVWCPMRWLFAAHIILDTLFLVLGFIYSITIAVYSFILYVLVADMGLYVLLQWLSFAIAVNMVLVIYLILFVITLRCCKLVVGERWPYGRNRSISCATAASNEPTFYQEIGHPDGNLL